MPLHASITAAKTVSRASAALSGLSPSITDTISATSMTVTATASTSVPNGSPIRCAMSSAWWTAAKTAAMSARPLSAEMGPDAFGHAMKSAATASAGVIVGHAVRIEKRLTQPIFGSNLWKRSLESALS